MGFCGLKDPTNSVQANYPWHSPTIYVSLRNININNTNNNSVIVDCRCSCAVDYFSFVLTDIGSKFRFGFCRLSADSESCLCIVR